MALPAETVTGLYLHGLAANRGVAYRSRTAGGTWHDWSWRDVEVRVRELAHGLIALGVGHGDRIGILADTRVEWTLIDLAALSLGAVSVPAYTVASDEDTAHVMRDAEVRVLVVEDRAQAERIARLRGELPALERVVVMEAKGASGDELTLDRLAAMGVTHAASHPSAVDEARAAVRPDDLLTIIYTSGTTGRPRGCRILQRNYAAMARIAIAVPGLCRPGDRCLLFLPLAHCFARLMPYVGLTGDVTICFATSIARLRTDLVETKPHLLPTVPRALQAAHDGIRDQLAAAHGARRRLVRWALDVGERVANVRAAGQPMPPGLAAQHRLADAVLFRRVRAGFGGEIRTIISGGAALDPDVARFLHVLDLPVLEGYGQTECTTAAAFNRPHRYRVGTVGPPLPHVDVRLAEDGEIELRGPIVFAGYHGDDEATAAVLVDGWLRTGDVGTIDEDGFMRLTDRKRDLIVLTNGKNIAPQRVEGLLAARPTISQAVVLGDRRAYLVALVTVPQDARARLGDGLRAAVKADVDAVNETLAPVERIRRFHVLDEEFSTQNGDLTPTLKVRRGVVAGRHAGVVEQLYGAG